jgi:DNA replication protein DnaC
VLQDRCPLGRCDGSGFLEEEGPPRAVTPCDCRAQTIQRNRSRSLSGVIPRRYRGVSFDRQPVVDMEPSIVREVKRFCQGVEAQLDAGRGLWFLGDVGTGKTTLAMLVSRHALEAGRTVAIYSLPRLLAEIRTTFDDPGERSYLSLMDRLVAVDLLHIDDVGAEKTSPWVLEQLYALVNARYEEQRSIVLTTNISERDELCEQIGERTVSRLTEMCEELPLFGNDRRGEIPAPGNDGIADVGDVSAARGP